MQPAEHKSDYCKNCTFPISAYLERMAFTEAPNVNIPFLKKIHTAHIKNIPFETLDIFLNKRFTLTLSDLYDKIVTRRRGGYCYELNGLFFYLLQQLGFEVSIHSAHLYDSNGVEIKTSQHMILVTNFQGDWLVDVGYGNGFLEPLSLDNPQPQEQGHRIFRCLQRDEKYIVQKLTEGIWKSWYAFVKFPKKVADFEERNCFHQCNQDSVFHKKRICMISREDETIELTGNMLVRQSKKRKYETIISEEEIPMLLKTEFGINHWE